MTDTFRLVDAARRGALDESGLRRLEMVFKSQADVALEVRLMALFDEARVHDEGDADVDVACALAAHEADSFEERATTRYDAMTDTIVERVLADHREELTWFDSEIAVPALDPHAWFDSTATNEIAAPALDPDAWSEATSESPAPVVRASARPRRREQTAITAVTEIWSAQPAGRRMAIMRGFAVAAGLLLSLGAGWAARGVFHVPPEAPPMAAAPPAALPSAELMLDQAARAEAEGERATAARLYRDVVEAGDDEAAEAARRALVRLEATRSR